MVYTVHEAYIIKFPGRIGLQISPRIMYRQLIYLLSRRQFYHSKKHLVLYKLNFADECYKILNRLDSIFYFLVDGYDVPGLALTEGAGVK